MHSGQGFKPVILLPVFFVPLHSEHVDIPESIFILFIAGIIFILTHSEFIQGPVNIFYLKIIFLEIFINPVKITSIKLLSNMFILGGIIGAQTEQT